MDRPTINLQLWTQRGRPEIPAYGHDAAGARDLLRGWLSVYVLYMERLDS